MEDNDMNGSSNGPVYPTGWPSVVANLKPGSYYVHAEIVDAFFPLGTAMETFQEYIRGWVYRKGVRKTGSDTLIFVSFRTKRGADESGIDIEVDMEVYHPVGDDAKYTITEIEEQGPSLKPTKVKLSNGAVVDVPEIELLEDMFQYAMNHRTYALQLLYLGSSYNPFKYRVTRIDLLTPNSDIAEGNGVTNGRIEITSSHTWTRSTKYDEWNASVGQPHLYLKLSEGSPANLEFAPFIPTKLKDKVVITNAAVAKMSQKQRDIPVEIQRLGDGNEITDRFEPQLTIDFLSGEYVGIGALGTIYWSFVAQVGEWAAAQRSFDTVAYSGPNKQTPENGFLLGGDVNLKFYLEEIETWKKQQV